MDSDSNSAGGDRLSKLGDCVLGHLLSFLPAGEAARAAALSRRWRHVFSHVHTLSMEEAEPCIPGFTDPGSLDSGYDPRRDCYSSLAVPAPPFADVVSAAVLGRHRRRGGGAAGTPLRALRVGFESFSVASAGMMDGWLSYAMMQAGDELHVDLRLRRENVCSRRYSLRRRRDTGTNNDGGEEEEDPMSPEMNDLDGEEENAASPKNEPPASPLSDDDDDDEPHPPKKNEYVTPRSLFSCAALRTLRLGSCRLDLPAAAIALPSLDTLHLTRITGRKGAIRRLVSGCPRLADLTLEACEKLTKLVVPGTRLRRLVLRCCHDLTTVVVDSSELRVFVYRGAVPEPSFLTLRGGPCRIFSCALDFCGEEASDPAELARLMDFLQLFAGVEHLHLTSARLGGAAFSSSPAFPRLRHLELTGILLDDDDAVVAAVARILRRTPSLETLTIFFLPEPELPDQEEDDDHCFYYAQELLDAHRLRYDRHAAVIVPEGAEIRCLRERTREINLVHYQGAMAQRMLAKFLLRNAPVVDEVCGEFAQGPLRIQNKLMEEIRGWVINKSANTMFF